MPHDASNAISVTSLKLLRFFLDATDCRDGSYRRFQAAGLPVPSIIIPRARLMVAATPCDRPMFDDAMVRGAKRVSSDILLVRHGLRPEILDPITIDVVATRHGRRVRSLALMPYLDEWGGLWLIPGATSISPFIQIASRGLTWSDSAPFGHPDERHAGLLRVARAIILRHRT